MTANVTIYTQELKNVLSVPNKALRFTPSEVLLKKEESISDVKAAHKLWVKEGNVFKAIPVELGTTNGSLTQILSGVSAGTRVLTDMQSAICTEEEDNHG